MELSFSVLVGYNLEKHHEKPPSVWCNVELKEKMNGAGGLEKN